MKIRALKTCTQIQNYISKKANKSKILCMELQLVQTFVQISLWINVFLLKWHLMIFHRVFVQGGRVNLGNDSYLSSEDKMIDLNVMNRAKTSSISV